MPRPPVGHLPGQVARLRRAVVAAKATPSASPAWEAFAQTRPDRASAAQWCGRADRAARAVNSSCVSVLVRSTCISWRTRRALRNCSFS
eukprot:5256869-Lingulodinium_polyedra.AAC.1